MKQEKLVIVIAVLLASMAQAEAVESNATPTLLSRLYVGVDGGMQRTGIRNMDRPKDDADWQAAATFNSTMQRFSVGYRFAPHFAMELGYLPGFGIRRKSETDVKTYDAGEDLHGIDLAVVYRFTEKLPGLFLKGGVSYMESDAWIKYDALRASNNGKQETVRIGENINGAGLGFVGGIGYELKLTDNFGVNVMYTRYQGLGGHNYSAMDFASVGAKYYF